MRFATTPLRQLLCCLFPLLFVGALTSQLVAQQPTTEDSPPAAIATTTDASAEEPAQSFEERIDGGLGHVVGFLNRLVFFDLTTLWGGDTREHTDANNNVIIGPDGEPVRTKVPLLVIWLIVGAVFFTLKMRLVNVRLFKHAIDIVRGKFSRRDDVGEVSHFQALSAALSATVGLGNIAGVAIAVSLGGPGATFWMIIAGLLGMSLKFAECSMGQMYRHIDAAGHVSGGPMHYLRDGLEKMGFKPLGVGLAVSFSLFCIGGSLAGGNAFQVFQSKGIVAQEFSIFQEHGWIYGVVMAIFVAIVIIGGIRRISQTAERIVPFMCALYVLACLAILLVHWRDVPAAFGSIVVGAFNADAIYGGVIGSLVMGFRRAAFSNEAGLGSAPIAHSAARTAYPVREGIVALLEPFIDTVVVCTMTALVIVITGVYNSPEHASLVIAKEGAALTNAAFQSVSFLSWFKWILLVAVVLFAFSTMISWSYYGERCWTNLFGKKSAIIYKLMFLVFVVLGSIMSGTNALDLGDTMIFLMAFPNVLGLYFLSGELRRALASYEADFKADKFTQ